MSEIQNDESALPRGWRWVRLREVCETDSNQVLPKTSLAKQLPYIGLEHIESGTGRILGTTNDPDGKVIQSITFRFDSRYVLYGKLRPYLNKVATPDFEGRCTTELLPLLPNDGCDRYFLAWLLRRAETVEEAMRHKTGTRMPRADMGELLKMLVPYPPLPEQRRIAAKLQELMQEVKRARTACEKQLEATKDLPSAYLRELFESESAKKWERKRLGDSVSFIKNGMVAEQNFDGRGFPVTRIETISNGVIDSEKIGWVNLPVENFTDFRLCKGDILFSHINSVERLGNCAIYEGFPEGLYHGMNLLRIKTNESIIDSYFLLFWLRSGICKDYYITNARRAIGQASLNQKDIKQIPVLLPPTEVQRRIVSELQEKMGQVNKLRTAIEKHLEPINALPQAILRKAFTGEL